MSLISDRNSVPQILIIFLTLGLCSCSTVTTPVLRHATGETLGSGKFRFYGHFESSRLFSPSTTEETAGIAQGSEVYRGSLLGVQGDIGVLPQLDVQLGANFSVGGGGWRVGSKYQLLKKGIFSLAVMGGYGVGSGTGTVTYMTSGTPVDITQTISAYTLDLSAPVSVRLGPYLSIYSGVMILRSGVSGSFGGSVISDNANDLGTNLGVKANFGKFEGDLECALLRVHDPFTDSGSLVPYFGFSFGVVF